MMMEYFMEGPVGSRMRINGRERDYFAGTGYLGLQNRPEVLKAASDALQKYGLSTATSRGGFGEHPLYTKLEIELRAFFHLDRVMYIASGYLGTSNLICSLQGVFDHIFIDQSAHYSVWDGARTSGKPLTPFIHCSAESLEEQLRQNLKPGERPLVLSDGVFPISGEIVPLPQYLPLVERYDGMIGLDDAHAVGVIGKNGWGVADYYGISSERCTSTATLSKALGGYGGVTILNGNNNEPGRFLPIQAGSTPPPLPVTAASTMALYLARNEPELRLLLEINVNQARQGLRLLGWDLEDNAIPILCLGAKPGVDLGGLQQELFEHDLCVAHIRNYSSAPAGGALRIAIFATHTACQIERLISTIGKLM
jgi:8-amino-7-oxononanoate synthase